MKIVDKFIYTLIISLTMSISIFLCSVSLMDMHTTRFGMNPFMILLFSSSVLMHSFKEYEKL